jgi:cell division transport system permease protein
MLKWNSRKFFTLFSVVLVLTLFGIYGITLLHTSNMTKILKENINLIAELDANLKVDQVDKIKQAIGQLEQVKTETIRYISKSEALIEMNNELGSSSMLSESDNPFKDVILFNVTAEFVDTEGLQNVRSEVEIINGISELSYYEKIYEYVGSNVRKVINVLLVLGLILSFFAFALIYSTIQLNLYADRFKIRTMELVGANWAQIRKPFIADSLRLALQSTIVSVLILSFLLILLATQFTHFKKVFNFGYVSLVVICMFVFSVFITQLASYMVVNRYLGASKSKFY